MNESCITYELATLVLFADCFDSLLQCWNSRSSRFGNERRLCTSWQLNRAVRVELGIVRRRRDVDVPQSTSQTAGDRSIIQWDEAKVEKGDERPVARARDERFRQIISNLSLHLAKRMTAEKDHRRKHQADTDRRE